jgi:hypothetical protein
MDGWESRRKRTEGHDIAVIQLGAAGVIKGFDVDTSHFLGNQPQACSIEACYAPDGLGERANVGGGTANRPGFAALRGTRVGSSVAQPAHIRCRLSVRPSHHPAQCATGQPTTARQPLHC